MEAGVGKNASYAWRSILAAQHLVKRGLRWQVGDGRHIRVWQDQWLPTRSTYKVVSPERPGNQVRMVSELLREGSMEWDIELVKRLFLPQDVEAILSTPLSVSAAADRMVWVEDKKGRFSVKSAYRLARETEAEDGKASCSDPTKLHGAWKGVWRMNLPNRLKHFTWKACNGILATKESLFKRKITADDLCEACGSQVETTLHMLCFCNHSTEVWNSCKLFLPFNIQESWGFLDTFSRLRSFWDTQKEKLERWVAISWGIWKNRNEVRHGGAKRPGQVIVRHALRLVEDFHAANVVPCQLRACSQDTTIWRPPPPGYYKVNVDGALFAKSN